MANAHYVIGAVAVGRKDWSTARSSLAIAAMCARDEGLQLLARRWQVEALYQLGEYHEITDTLPSLLGEYRTDGETWSQLALRLAQSYLHSSDCPAAERRLADSG